MALQFAHLRQPHGIIRLATLLLGLVGLAFIIADLILQNTEALIAYELATTPAISITTVRMAPRYRCSRLQLTSKVRLDDSLVSKRGLRPPVPWLVSSRRRHRPRFYRLGTGLGLWGLAAVPSGLLQLCEGLQIVLHHAARVCDGTRAHGCRVAGRDVCLGLWVRL